MALALTLASCATPPTPVPPPPPEPPLNFTCAANETTALEYDVFPVSLRGKCIGTRGLAAVETLRDIHDGTSVTTVYLYKNGSDLATWNGSRDHPPTFRIALIWQAGLPDSFKSHPRFIEIIGRYTQCVGKAICGNAAMAIAVSSFKAMPTAMD